MEPGVLGCFPILTLGAGCTGEFCSCKSLEQYASGRCSLVDSILREEKSSYKKKVRTGGAQFLPHTKPREKQRARSSSTQCGYTKAIQSCRPEEGECPPIRWTPFPFRGAKHKPPLLVHFRMVNRARNHLGFIL